jgi:mannose-1-phosphate guanylyltransferase
MRDSVLQQANEALLTIGIKPDRPETGYGYIQANEKIAIRGLQGTDAG